MSEFENLAARERQIVEAVYRLEEAAVADVLAALSDPPSYSAVRAILNILVQKGHLTYKKDKNRYIYLPAISKQSAQKSLLRNLINNFFGGKPTEAMAALLDVSAEELDANDYKALRAMINDATHNTNDEVLP